MLNDHSLLTLQVVMKYSFYCVKRKRQRGDLEDMELALCGRFVARDKKVINIIYHSLCKGFMTIHYPAYKSITL